MSDIDISLIVKYLQEQTDSEETLRIETWINESEQNRSEVNRIAELFFTKRAYDRMTSRDVDLAYQAVQQHINEESNRKNVHFKRRSLLYAAAASIIGAILLSSVYYFLREKEIIPHVNYITAKSNPGVRTRIDLSDGTVVYLNSETEFTYPDHFTGNQRNVKLEGEAFFNVKTDPDKPFVVHTTDDRATIQALGTSFNVQSFSNDNVFTTTLVEGFVNVKLKLKNGEFSQIKLIQPEKIIFDKNTGKLTQSNTSNPNSQNSNRIIYNKNTDNLTVGESDTEIETAWLKDKIIFRNTPMPQVLKTLASTFNAEFEIRNQAIYSYRFTGTFQSRQLAQILEYFKISSNIKYTIYIPRSDDSMKIEKTRITLE